MKVGSFRELRVYREAFGLAQEVFRITRGFPGDERFGLISQARRSSRSACTNLAEAWRRRGYPAAFASKLVDAQGEAEETRVHLDFALACHYIDPATWQLLDRAYHRLLARLEHMRQHPERWVPRSRGEAPGRARSEATGRGKGKGQREAERGGAKAGPANGPVPHPPYPQAAPGKQEAPSNQPGPRTPLRRSGKGRGEAPGTVGTPAKSAPPARVPTAEPDP